MCSATARCGGACFVSASFTTPFRSGTCATRSLSGGAISRRSFRRRSRRPMARADAPGSSRMRAWMFVAGCCAAGAALADNKELLPLWEVGGGLAYAHLPDYRGSDEAHSYVLPFPLLVYRGD